MPGRPGAVMSFFAETFMNKHPTVESLIQKLMLEADAAHLAARAVRSTGFAVYTEPDDSRSCAYMYAKRPVQTLESLRRFAVGLRNVVKVKNATVAGIVCDLPASVDNNEPVKSIIIYVDQKFDGMRVWIASQVAGQHLMFRDMGKAHPSTNFLPPLFVAEAYGPTLAEA